MNKNLWQCASDPNYCLNGGRGSVWDERQLEWDLTVEELLWRVRLCLRFEATCTCTSKSAFMYMYCTIMHLHSCISWYIHIIDSCVFQTETIPYSLGFPSYFFCLYESSSRFFPIQIENSCFFTDLALLASRHVHGLLLCKQYLSAQNRDRCQTQLRRINSRSSPAHSWLLYC